jgi:hypothetical protein
MQISREAFAEAFALAVKLKQPLLLSPRGKAVSFLCSPIAISEDAILFSNSIPVDVLPHIVTSSEFTVSVGDFQVISPALFSHGTDIRFPTHNISLLPQSRSEERKIFSSQDRAEVVIVHPFDGGTVLRRRLYDISRGGLSFRARTQTRLMQPGRIFSKLEIIQSGKPSDVRTGRVVYIKQIFEENGRHYYQVGVQFITKT